MNITILKTFGVLAAASAIFPASAQDLKQVVDDFRQTSATGQVSHEYLVDNDSLLLNKSDGLYTSGLRYTRLATRSEGGRQHTTGWRIGQELYTASDIKFTAEEIGPPNRPYAGWLYGGVFNEFKEADGSYIRYGLDLGCMGPCAAGEVTQKTLHRALNQPLPQAWKTQLPNEFGVVLHAEAGAAPWQLSRNAELAPRVFGRFGNIYTDVGVGATLSVGRLRPIDNRAAWYGFVRADGKAVAYNATLEGGMFARSHPNEVKPRRLTGELAIGTVWEKRRWAIEASFIRRGNEIGQLADALGRENFIRLLFTYTP